MLSVLILALAILGANADSYGYGNVLPQTESPFNPCTEQAMRSNEIQLFANPEDKESYLICTDVDVFMKMPCPPGTMFEESVRHCVPFGWEAPLCPAGTCMNNADCVLNEMGSPMCMCRVGFTGERCEVNIDDCAMEGNQACAANNGKCVDQINAYYCEYMEGEEIGMSFEKRIPRPCSMEALASGKQFFELESESANFYLQCTSEFVFVVNKCADMLFWHQELKTCTIERPLAKTGVCKQYPCQNDGECEDLGNSNFMCHCKEGFTGSMCEEVVDFCLNKPCQNGGRCISHPGGYNCVCQDNLVDGSCATGCPNKCNEEGALMYMPNPVDETKYIACNLGYGFVKSCAPGLIWNQDLLTCMMREVPKAPTHAGFSNYRNYGNYQAEPVTMPPMVVQPTESSYGNYKAEPVTMPPMVVQPKMIPMRDQPSVMPTRPMMPTLPQMIEKSSYGSYQAEPVEVPMKPTPSVMPTRPMMPRPPMNTFSNAYGQRMLSYLKY